MKPIKRALKNQISQAQADENKRKQLQSILEEQHKKMLEKQDKLKGVSDLNKLDKSVPGVSGRN